MGHFVLYRFLFGCAGLLPLVERPRFSGREWRLLGIGSFLGIPVQFLVQFYGLKLTTVSHAALMVGTMPVILAVGATMFSQEHLDGKGWLAVMGSTAGIVLIVSSSERGSLRGGSLEGDLLVIAAMFLALGWILINQRLMKSGHSPMTVTIWGLLVGTAMLAVWVLAQDGLPPVRGVGLTIWGAVLASGLLCTAASTALWNWGIHHAPASRAGVFLNIEPAVGAVLGVELLGDKLGAGAWIGGRADHCGGGGADDDRTRRTGSAGGVRVVESGITDRADRGKRLSETGARRFLRHLSGRMPLQRRER